MNLTDRINERRNPDNKIVPLIERRGGTEQRPPEWLRRAQEGRLPVSDRTGQMKVAA